MLFFTSSCLKGTPWFMTSCRKFARRVITSLSTFFPLESRSIYLQTCLIGQKESNTEKCKFKTTIVLLDFCKNLCQSKYKIYLVSIAVLNIFHAIELFDISGITKCIIWRIGLTQYSILNLIIWNCYSQSITYLAIYIISHSFTCTVLLCIKTFIC